MKTLILLAATAAAAPAYAQHQHQHQHHQPQRPQEPDPHAHHRREAPAPEPDPHAHHRQQGEPTSEPDPHAHHHPSQAEPEAAHHDHHVPDRESGHEGYGGHAGHGGHGEEMRNPPRPPVGPAPPGAFSGPAHAADLVFGAQRMAPVREHIRREHGGMLAQRVLLDRLEARIGGGHQGYAWDAQAWYGGDIDKLWLKSEGEGEFGGRLEQAELQALWSRAIDPWFDVQLGVRQDFRPVPQRTHAVLGVQGLAPYWFEVEAMLFLSHRGELTARFEGEYDLRITQQLILQPSVEVDFAFQDMPDIGIGAGLSQAELGARLRYELRPEFAPYVGVHYERGLGNTARFARAAGREAGGWNVLVGIRTWF